MTAIAEETESRLPEAKVLLADDSPISQTATRFMLNHLGVEVDVAAHGRAAVDLSAEHDYDLILMDCQMPIMDGYEATRAIREREQLPQAGSDAAGRTPIVALSGRILDSDRAECLQYGMDDCLGKPFDLANLQACLQRWLTDEAFSSS